MLRKNIIINQLNKNDEKNCFTTVILIFNFSFSQKKELRKAQKLYDAGDIAGASQILTENQSLLESADQKIKPNYNFLRGKIAQNNKEFQEAYDLFNSVKEVASIKDNVLQQLNLLSADIVNSAIDDNGSGDFKSSSRNCIWPIWSIQNSIKTIFIWLTVL